MVALVASELLDPGGAGHIHLDQFLADQVQADEPKPVGTKFGCHGTDELSLAGAQIAGLNLTARVDVGAHVVFARHAQDGTERFTIE